MKASARARLEFPTADEARAAMQALAPDNGEFLRASVDGRTLQLEATAATPLGLLRTLEDAITCLRALGGAEASDEDS